MESSVPLFARVLEAENFIRQRLPISLSQCSVGIICGSGLGSLSEAITPSPRCEIEYSAIPYFPRSSVPGHAGKLLFGRLESEVQPVVLMLGRAHYYEGFSMQDISFPIRALKRMGVQTLLVTNAAGALNRKYAVGDVVVLQDHLNLPGLCGLHPLRGPNADGFGERFLALSDAYDLDLRRRAHRAWSRLPKGGSAGRKLHEGVYAFVSGPSYETRAECRMLRAIGADLVGMSTVPEIVVARHCNIKILAFSLVTNLSVLDAGPKGDAPQVQLDGQGTLSKIICEGRANHEMRLRDGTLAMLKSRLCQEVLDAGRDAAKDVQLLISTLIKDLFSAQGIR